MKWEYLVIDRALDLAYLNQYGALGWELVSAARCPHHSKTWDFVFKRPVDPREVTPAILKSSGETDAQMEAAYKEQLMNPSPKKPIDEPSGHA